jgi:cation diffusion facilitator family transporter
LLAAKVAAFLASGSKAVLASATDSLVDLASQVVLALASAAAARRDPRYPVGKARMTTVGVASAAGLMIGATALVVQTAATDLYEGLALSRPPSLVVGPALFAVLLGGTLLKVGLFVLCARAARSAPPGAADTLSALAEDHRTDALTNVVAAAASAAVVAGGPAAWPVDPCAALVLSAYILWVWGRIFGRTVSKLVGRGAPPEVMAALEVVCASHAPADIAAVDVLKAWFAGDALLCECEIVMSPDARLRTTHDVALSLQHALEAVRVGDVAVERAYVHVDYARRAEPEHAPDRAAAAAERGAGGV